MSSDASTCASSGKRECVREREREREREYDARRRSSLVSTMGRECWCCSPHPTPSLGNAHLQFSPTPRVASDQAAAEGIYKTSEVNEESSVQLESH